MTTRREFIAVAALITAVVPLTSSLPLAAKSRAPEPNQALVVAFLATLPILELDWVAAERFGRVKTDLERAGNLLADADLLTV